MHGDETVGRELSLYLIEWLVEGYGSDPRATDIINNTDVFIMPTMNPDGFESGSRYNANGVDLNRDFPDQFNDPSNTLNGRQPETRAVMQWTWEHNFVLSANMHSGALVANYPYNPVGLPAHQARNWLTRSSLACQLIISFHRKDRLNFLLEHLSFVDLTAFDWIV